jgi:PAS domain S-box-containing protein
MSSKLLLIETDLKVVTALEKVGLSNYVLAQTFEQAQTFLRQRPSFDTVLLNPHLPDRAGLALIPLAPPESVILMGQAGDEALCLAALQAGAVHTLIKDESAIYLQILPLLIQRQQAYQQCLRRDATLRLQQNHLQQILNTMQDAMISVSLPSRELVFMSASFEKIFGHPIQRFLEDPQFFTQVVHPDDLELVTRAMQTALREGFVEATHRIVLPSGEVRWIFRRAWVNFDEQGRPSQINDTARDITQERLAQEALQEAYELMEQRMVERTAELAEERNLLRTLIDTIPDFIYIKDLNHRMVLNNRAYALALGLAHPAQAVGKTDFDLFPPEVATKWMADERQVFQTGQALLNCEERFVSKTGQAFWALTTKVPLHNLQGEITGLVGITHDISQLKEAEDALRSALEKEKELSNLKSRFVLMTSHEFRTPLAAILATTESLLHYRERMDNRQIDQRLEKIRQQVEHMKNMMEDVLQLARIQGERIEFRPIQADLDALCRDLVEDFLSAGGRTPQTLIYTCHAPALQATYDPHLMRQALNNILSNADKYSDPTRPIRFTLAQVADQALLTIQDEGLGIPPEDLPHLFNAFHRGTNVGTIAGTGLGLSISKQALALHGASLHIESQVGQGTTVTIRMPLPHT